MYLTFVHNSGANPLVDELLGLSDETRLPDIALSLAINQLTPAILWQSLKEVHFSPFGGCDSLMDKRFAGLFQPGTKHSSPMPPYDVVGGDTDAWGKAW